MTNHHRQGSRSAEPFPKEKLDELENLALKMLVSNKGSEPTLGIFILLSLETGLRIGDLQRLTIGDFKPLSEKKAISAYAYHLPKFFEQKTGKESNATISTELFEFLCSFLNKRHKNGIPKSYPFMYSKRTHTSMLKRGAVNDAELFGWNEVVPSGEKEKLKHHSPLVTHNRSWVKNRMEAAAKKLGIEGEILSAHSLRKAASTYLIRQAHKSGNDMTISDLQELYNHSSPRITEGYLANNKKERGAEHLAKLRFGVR